MRNIRYFGQLVDPAVYRRGFGVWGWLVAFLNVIRVWLERRQVYIVLRIERKAAKMTERQALAYMAETPTGEAPAVPNLVRRLMRNKSPLNYATLDERTHAKYAEGRRNHETPARPLPIEQSSLAVTFAQTAMRADRSVRYLTGRKFMNDQGDADVTAVPRSRRSRRMEAKKTEHNPQPTTPAEQAGEPLPVPLTQQEIKSQIMSADFAMGANTKHLRVGGLTKNRK